MNLYKVSNDSEIYTCHCYTGFGGRSGNRKEILQNLPKAIIISAITTGIVVVLATYLIEKFGGAVGGILGTVPSTTIIASIGLYMNLTEKEMLTALWTTPFAGLLNIFVLGVWKFGYDFVPTSLSKVAQGIMLLVGSLIVWILGAVFVVFVGPLLQTQFGLVATGSIVFIMQFELAFIIAWFYTKRTPKGESEVTNAVYAARGFVSGLAMAAIILLSKLNAQLGGLLSVFPLITLMNILSLWISQPCEVVLGSIGPMMIGGTAVISFSLFFVASITNWQLFPSLVFSTLASVVGVTQPIYFIFNARYSSLQKEENNKTVQAHQSVTIDTSTTTVECNNTCEEITVNIEGKDTNQHSYNNETVTTTDQKS